MKKRDLPLWIFSLLFAVGMVAAGRFALPVAAAGASISGTVTDGNAQPIGNITVALVRDMSAIYGYPSWQYSNSILTDNSGAYTFTDLEAGTYRIEFRDDTFPPVFATTYFDQAGNGAVATDIVVNDGDTVTNINTQLSLRGALGGHITNQSGNPLSNIAVFLDVEVTTYEGNVYWNNAAFTTTNANGDYHIDSLNPGNYRLGFQDYNGVARYAPEVYDNVETYDEATIVPLAAGQAITDINATLDALGTIQGLVTDGNGLPVSNIAVQLYQYINDPSQPFWRNAQSFNTESDGTYRFPALSPGLYRVGFTHDSYPIAYAPEFYNDAATFAEAADIAVSNGITVTDINAQLEAPGGINGHVTNVQGDPLEMVTVRLYKLEPDGNYWNNLETTQTDQDGFYTFAALAGGDYRLQFSIDYISPSPYEPEFYNNAVTLEEATTVQVTRGMVVDNLDVALAPYAKITGRVTDVEGEPVAGVNVTPFQYFADGTYWNQMPGTFTGPSGYYTLTGLLEGVYNIEFRSECCPLQYITEIFDDAPNLLEGTKLTVTRGLHISGIDAQLTRYGEISGRVTDEAGNPLVNIFVDALYPQPNSDGEIWNSLYGDYSDSDGRYQIQQLPGDYYRVRFNYNREDGYVPAYWQNTLDFDLATTISLPLNSHVTGIDAQLVQGGTLGGAIETADGRTTNLRTWLYQYHPNTLGQDPWEPIQTDFGSYTGAFLFRGLDAGIYRLGFFDEQNPGYHPAYYPGQPYIEAGQSFEITLGQWITDVHDVLLWPSETNFPPYANGDIITLFEGSATRKLDTGVDSVLGNDKDEWELWTNKLTATLVTPPRHGRVTLAADGRFTYQHDGSDIATDSFSYQAHDEIQPSNVATVTVKVIPVNEKPYAIGDRIVVMRGDQTSMLDSGATTLTANDLDFEGDPLTVTLATAPEHGTLVLAPSGTFTYTHDGGNAGSDQFTYRASDGEYTSDPATVSIVINPAARFAFSKTVGIAGIEPACTPTAEIHAPRNTTMIYCYTVTNSGEVPLLYHSLSDSHLGTLLTDAPYLLLPGRSYSVEFTQTLTVSTTNVATWTASTGPLATVRSFQSPRIEAGNRTAATVIISSAADDLDGDTIPDNIEGAGDPDGDNLPNFLDTDSDNDGMTDRAEAGANPGMPLDNNNNGTPDYLERTERLYLPLIAR